MLVTFVFLHNWIMSLGRKSRYKSYAEIAKENERDARVLIIDLYNRIKTVTGEVTEWADIRVSGNALNGFVVGKEGRAKVETTLAGGYNIQRLHIRVLVHSI